MNTSEIIEMLKECTEVDETSRDWKQKNLIEQLQPSDLGFAITQDHSSGVEHCYFVHKNGSEETIIWHGKQWPGGEKDPGMKCSPLEECIQAGCENLQGSMEGFIKALRARLE